MSAKEQSERSTALVTTTMNSLDAVLTETSRKDPEVRGLVEEFIQTISSFGVTISKNASHTIDLSIEAIDEAISQQLAEILHAPEFQATEGAWRGLAHLVFNSETGSSLKVRTMQLNKTELIDDCQSAISYDQSLLWKKLHDDEFGMPGGKPYAAIIGDYAWENHPDDIGALRAIQGVAAAAFCPFVTSPSPQVFGLESWSKIADLRDLEKSFDSPVYAQWNSLRDSEDSRFLVMAMPRVLARVPYGKNTRRVKEFDFEEVPVDERGGNVAVPHDHFCWMNAAYVFGTQMTKAFSDTGWCTSVRGFANGGKVSELPVYTFKTDDGDIDMKCPTEVAITERKEVSLSKLGMLPLCHYKGEDYAVFFGGQTLQKPPRFEGKGSKEKNDNARLNACIQHVMAVSRISHYLKVGARDRIGSMVEIEECEAWLNDWISNYVLQDEKATPEMKARFPLAAAKISVEPGENPGEYNAVAYLRPWLPLEQLTTSMRLVAKIPTKSA